MENQANLIQIFLDGGLLFFSCEQIFREKSDRRPGDLALLPALTVFCMAARIHVIAGGRAPALFPARGFEIAPSDNLMTFLFLLLSVLLLNSLYYKTGDNGYAFCGTMAVFSIYLLSRTVSVAVFSVCGAEGRLLLFGSRILSFVAAGLLLCPPALQWLRSAFRNGGFIVRLVSANIAAALIAVLSALSFEIERVMENFWMITAMLFAILLLDSAMLYYSQRRVQEQKHIRMIEQYVPIVEELISQVRARQHEFNNRIFAIDAAVQSAETLEEARQNVSKLTKGTAIGINDHELLACDSKIIAGMLYGKIKQAEFLEIDVQIQLHGLFRKSVTPETEWIEVIGILLDNGLEASKGGDTVCVKSRQNGSCLEFTVSNPSGSMSNSEFMHLFGKGVTSKKEKAGHGFGLYNVLCMTQRYHGKILTRNEQVDGKNYVVFGVLLP